MGSADKLWRFLGRGASFRLSCSVGTEDRQLLRMEAVIAGDVAAGIGSRKLFDHWKQER